MPWVGGRYVMGREVDIPWVRGVQNTIGRGVDISWVGG